MILIREKYLNCRFYSILLLLFLGPQPSPKDLLWPLSADEPYTVPDEVWEFPRDRLYIRQRIGEGLMGEVRRRRRHRQ